ncbi:aminodeoxychorismate synthase component I [Corynebacterium appendicis]|uniref:aminodeoxychorismate synthase component I n=1 Tax=Corynebacterium appendicis TaxID=163202 RepID=UPI0023553327|nr:aminodeoxychorismate synthase component I [Corynebacterium appendicis]MDK8624926.1 aminodeoxychorismate synthase component I [Corynebacterium appendicis]
MRTLLIDNFDSFTYNLRDLAHRVFGTEPVVITNDANWADIALDDFDGIIVSPGPGRPQRSGDLGISQQAFDQNRLPVLGVCLGHQALSFASGATVDLAPEPMHGRVTSVHHYDADLFHGVPQGFRAVRYHSLAVTDLPADVEPTAWTPDGVVMAVRHRTRPYWGIQFHPESALTEWGEAMLMNFQALVHTHPRTATTDHLALVRHPQYHRRLRVEWQRINGEPDAQRLFESLYSARETSFWLDSSTTDPVSKRLTIMGDATGPLAEVLQYDVISRQWRVRGNDGERIVNQDFYTYLRAQLHERAVPAVEELPFDFNLGYVGALGYELKDETVGTPAHRSPHPDAALIFADRAIVIDHRECYTYLLTLVDDSQPTTWTAAADWLSQTSATVREAVTEADDRRSEAANVPILTEPAALEFELDQNRASYLASIQTCLEKIRDGESYEICLTNMAEAGPIADAYAAYRALRQTSPVPFGAFLRLGDLAILSASPERFLRVGVDHQVEAKPIKGTRPRGTTPGDDQKLRKDLSTNGKDRAENLMIVDLLRNDLNRVCTVGSVRADDIFTVETFSHVHQLVSTITGTLRPELTAVDCVQATFPGGSMTGAPKIRTMEIISSLEHRARGFYSGAIGWFSLSGAADLSITIRTLVSDHTSTTFGVGGAIVAQSDPLDEFEETLVKASALLTALESKVTNA